MSQQPPTWILRTSPASPFGRKVRLAIEALNLTPAVRIELADTADPADSLRTQNALGKIPTLLLPDGSVLFDSRVIVEYLDHQDGRSRLIPPTRRFEVLREQALADGLLDAALLQVYERRFRPDTHYVTTWLDYQQAKVLRALAAFEAVPPPPGVDGPHIGEIALAAALGYLDLRFAGRWRADHPALVQWLEGFVTRMPIFNHLVPA